MQMHDGTLDLSALRERMSTTELAAWLGRAEVRAQLAALCEAGELQSRLMTSRYRANVASRLMSLALDKDSGASPETVRRACVDALKLGLADRASMPLSLPGQSRAAGLRELVERDVADEDAEAGGAR